MINEIRALKPVSKLEEMRTIKESNAFEAEAYLAANPDFATLDMDPIEHYVRVGSARGARPRRDFDPLVYLALNPDVAEAELEPFAHYLRYGQVEGRPTSVPFADQDVNVRVERVRQMSFSRRHGLFRPTNLLNRCRRAARELAAMTPTASVRVGGKRMVSIIVPIYGQVPFALHCLDSLSRHASRYPFEIILFDDASPAEMCTECLADIPWIRYIRAETNCGFLKACNTAVEHAAGSHVVLLNSDTRVCSGWLDELIDTFTDHPDAGLVGSKLFNDNGTLQEAGCIVWNDGSAWNYGRNDDAALPQYSYARRADYCSGAAIAVPVQLWRELGGFDSHFEPAYYEDVDLAFRIRKAGREVWFQPLAKVIHFEGKTHGRDESKGIKGYQAVNAKKFYLRWADALVAHRKNGDQPARESDRFRPKRLLAIDALTPTPNQDAGSVMSIKLLQICQKLGWHVTFHAAHDSRHQGRYSSDLQRLGIETLISPTMASLEDIIDSQPEYDVVLAFRAPVLKPLIARLRQAYPSALLLFHDIDLHYLRMQREAELNKDIVLRRKSELMQSDEFALVTNVDCTIVPSAVEKEILEKVLPVDNVVVYSYTADVVESEEKLDQRKHLIFIGGFRHSPNVDAMIYFINDVWPLIESKLPPESTLYIVGSEVPANLNRLAGDRIVLTGFLESVEPLMSSCRVIVAPLRYGAGLKGKVVTGLSHGVPGVASSVAIEGMGLTPGLNVLLADDRKAFAEAVVRLYADDATWRSVRKAGLTFVEENYSLGAGMKMVEHALEVADRTWLARKRRERNERIIDQRQLRLSARGEAAKIQE